MLVSVPAENPPTKLRAAIPWMREIVVIAAVYLVYSFVRNQFGSAKVKVGDDPVHAFHNAIHIINLEKAIGLFHEQSIQRWFVTTTGTGADRVVHANWIVEWFNVFYGTAHFVVTPALLIWLFIRHRENFSRWRTTAMVTTVLALVGFALFPLMPPRLINAPVSESVYSGENIALREHVPDFGFVDTLRDVGGLWNFDSKKMDSVSNQYAAMPSLHIGWSTWCMLVLLRFGKRRSTKILGVLYPIVTLLVIVATANHYIIDAAGGLVIIGAGYLIARGVDQLRGRHPEPVAEVPSEDVLIPG